MKSIPSLAIKPRFQSAQEHQRTQMVEFGGYDLQVCADLAQKL